MLTAARADAVLGRTAGRPWPLRLLVLALGDRCDQHCAHCGIWANAPAAGLRPGERMKLLDEALALGIRAALLTGGEPLLAPDLEAVAGRLWQGGAEVLLATNGRLLAERAEAVARWGSAVYVSLDGASAATHDGVRGVPTFARMAEGVARLRERAPHVGRVARCTLHRENIGEFSGIVAAARELGFQHVSFLPLDASSAAFGGHPAARKRLVPTEEQLVDFEAALVRLEVARARGEDRFVLESPARLRRLAAHLRASAGAASFTRPPCDAPWWSVVVEHDGTARPCFFHEPVGDARAGLAALRASAGYGDALAAIGRENATCARCVCPNHSGPRWREAWLRCPAARPVRTGAHA